MTYCFTRGNSRVSLLPPAARFWLAHPTQTHSVLSHAKKLQDVITHSTRVVTYETVAAIPCVLPALDGACFVWMERVLLCWEAPLYPFPARISLHVHDYSTPSCCICTAGSGMLRGSLVPQHCAHSTTCTAPLLPERAAKLLRVRIISG